jgi:plastocyanin
MKPLPLLLLTAAISAGACGGSDEPPRPPGPDEVVMIEYEFDPSDVTVKRGTTLTVRNEGEIAHNLEVRQGDEEVAGTDSFLGGKSEKLDIDIPPGRYTMICSVPGHEQLGMKGAITVR